MADRLCSLKSLDCYVLLHAPLVDWRLPSSLTTLVIASGGIERDLKALASLMECIARIEALQELDITQLCGADIAPLVGRLPRLTSLALFSPDGQIEALRSMRSLLHLRFITFANLRTLLPQLTHQPHELELQHLQLPCLAWHSAVVACVSQVPSLTTIDADWIPRGADLQFLHGFEGLTTLRCVLALSVDASPAEIESDAQALCDHLCTLPKLTVLDLRQAPLTNDHWTTILGRMPSLCSLSICGPGLRISSLRFLVDCGEQLASALTSLTLETCSHPLSADDLEFVCALHQLRTLALSRSTFLGNARPMIERLRPPSMRLPHLAELLL